MARIKIFTEPHEILRMKSKTVTDFDQRLHRLLDDMHDTMRAANGAGIAAVQVGYLVRAALVVTPDGVVELINPVIVKSSDFKTDTEGCLSVPNFDGKVSRAHNVTVQFQDRYGNHKKQIFRGRTAVCAAHETDHLDGILFIDKVI